MPEHEPESQPQPQPGPGSESVEWVGEDGAVIEVVSRRRMRAETLRHRCTYVAVLVGPVDRFARTRDADDPSSSWPPLSSADEIVVHRRADWKDVYPGHWDLAFGGVCEVGESWARSARRELAEEAGIDLTSVRSGDPLVDLGPVRWDGPGASLIGRVFVTSWPDPAVSVDGEAVAFDRVPLGELATWLDQRPVCPDSAALVTPLLADRIRS